MTNFFIFVFSEENYEGEANLGQFFKFPDTDRGGYKFAGKSCGSWGKIINLVEIGDKVIWTISGNSKRKDKKTVWGHGEVIEIDEADRKWLTKSTAFQNSIKLDEVVMELPEDYRKLYIQKNGVINIGYYGTIKIDEFQYDYFKEYCEID